MHWAIHEGSVDAVALLLDSGADPCLHSQAGLTCLQLAAGAAAPACLGLLIARQGSKAAPDLDPAVHMAVKRGSVECLRLLLDAGGDVDAPDREGWLPLQRAVWMGHAECILELRSRGARQLQPTSLLKERKATVQWP